MKSNHSMAGSLSSYGRKINCSNLALSLPTAIFLIFASLVQADDQSNQTNSPPTKPTLVSSGTVEIPADLQAALNLPDGPDRKTAFAAAIKAWAQINPVDAITWAGKVQDGVLNPLGVSSVASVWIANDDKAATDWAFAHGNGRQQHFIFGCYGVKYGKSAMEWLLQQPKHTAGQTGSIFEGWCHRGAGLQGADDAAAWLLQHKLSDDDTVVALQFIGSAKAYADPPNAAAWVLILPATFPQVGVAKIVAGIWSKRIPADIPKIQDWVNQLPLADDQKAQVSEAIVKK